MQKPQIILIDAFSQIYRGFFAIRYLSNSKGVPTNAVFALAKFLLSVNKEYPVEYGAFTFDKGKPAFRLEIAPLYKANRPPMPEEMKQQMPFIERLIQAFGWPSLVKEGYESDDIIAAIAKNFSEYPVKIVSSDKDIAQVINSRVQMLIPDRKSGGLMIQGEKEVFERFSVTPSQIVDYLSLIGDSSDNIPGVPGIGPKTAAKLIAEHNSISEMLNGPEKISNPKLKEKILQSKDILEKNIQLITLKTEIMEKEWNDIRTFKRKEPDWAELIRMCEDLELKSIIREIEKAAGEVQSVPNALKPEKEDDQKKAYTPDLFDL